LKDRHVLTTGNTGNAETFDGPFEDFTFLFSFHLCVVFGDRAVFNKHVVFHHVAKGELADLLELVALLTLWDIALDILPSTQDVDGFPSKWKPGLWFDRGLLTKQVPKY
jgi:hypothetical protein